VYFFGSDEITLPGYQLSKKLAEFQEAILEINKNKSKEKVAKKKTMTGFQRK
jgi:hypothetical protein